MKCGWPRRQPWIKITGHVWHDEHEPLMLLELNNTTLLFLIQQDVHVLTPQWPSICCRPFEHWEAFHYIWSIIYNSRCTSIHLFMNIQTRVQVLLGLERWISWHLCQHRVLACQSGWLMSVLINHCFGLCQRRTNRVKHRPQTHFSANGRWIYRS